MQNALKWLLAIPLLASLLVPILGWQIETRRMQRNWSQAVARNRDKPIPVRTVAVVEKDGIDIVGATCVSQPSASAPLLSIAYNPELSIRVVKSVHALEGHPVKKGDVIVEFEKELHEQSLAHAEQTAEQVQSQIENIEKILADGAASNLELATAKSTFAEATFLKQLAKKDLELSTVRAPFDGVVGEIPATPGAHMTTGSVICTIYQLDPIIVKVDFPIERLGAIAVGDQMEVTFDSFPDEEHYGKVVSIAPNARSQTRILNVFVELPNSDLRLKGGITGYARLQRARRAIAVPRTSVIRRKGRSMVFKVVDDVARLVEVKTGPVLVDGELELLEGLNPGDEVVVFGHDELVDGAPVNSDWIRWANRGDTLGSPEQWNDPSPPLNLAPLETDEPIPDDSSEANELSNELESDDATSNELESNETTR